MPRKNGKGNVILYDWRWLSFGADRALQFGSNFLHKLSFSRTKGKLAAIEKLDKHLI